MASDVLIIGGGLIGLAIARELHKNGISRITIVERTELGCESSWAAAGMLAPNVEVESNLDFHRFCTSSLDLYPALSDGLRDETGIDIELDRSGTLYVAFTDPDLAGLRERLERQVTAGSPVEHWSSAEIRRHEPFLSPEIREGLYFPNDWQVENRKLLAALRKFVETNGIRVVERSEVSNLLIDGRKIVGARTSSEEHYADTTVLATGAWTSLIKIGTDALPVVVKPVRGQMIRFDAGSRQIRRVVYSRRGYLTPRADGSVLAGATVEDVGFDKDTTTAGREALTAGAIEIAPGLASFAISEHWAGLRPFATDGLPVLGEIPGYEGGLLATAHYRNGILLAPKTAELIAAKIVSGVDSEFLERFGAERFTLTGVRASVV